jgi:hypothetical protein
VLSLGPGEAAGQLADVVSADQLAYGGVVRWRHCPVIAGCAAAPDPPPRVAAPERRKFGIPVVPARPGVHGGRRQAAGRPRRCGRRARAWMAAMRLPPPGGIRGAGQPGIRRRARRSGARGRPGRPADYPGRWSRGGQTKRQKRQPHRLPASRPLRGHVRVTRDPARALLSCISGGAPRGDGAPPEIMPGSGSSCPPPVSRGGTRASHNADRAARPPRYTPASASWRRPRTARIDRGRFQPATR